MGSAVAARRVRWPRLALSWPLPAVVWPFVAAVANAVAFFVVRPDVGDLQAALARQSAVQHGVGLFYWFNWFGGTTPGNYSVLSPYLSAYLGGAVLLGCLSTVVLPPLAYRALAGTRYQLGATWVAAITTGISLWSGRIPLALGSVAALVALIAVRERRLTVAVCATIVSTFCSPVCSAFLAFGLFAAFLVDQQIRRAAFTVCATCLVTLLLVAFVFGNPGTQPYSLLSALLCSMVSVVLLLGRPAPGVATACWLAAIAAPVLTLFDNGLGSNFNRLPWICLPVAVLATGKARKWLVVFAVLPALGFCLGATVKDLVHAHAPEASTSYYTSLINSLKKIPNLANYRLEVVQTPQVHTEAYALADQVALARGYETQADRQNNAILFDKAHLDATTFKIWLENNAVGWVALNKHAASNSPEYELVAGQRLPYLQVINSDAHWTLYRFRDATPIVAPPEQLVSVTQAALTLEVPCACRFPVRVRYSKFLEAKSGSASAQVSDDGTGWTVVVTSRPGRYVLSGI